MLTTPLPEVPPAWIELIPPGPDVAGNDGRRWRNDDPHTIVAAFQQRYRAVPMVIDYEHASEHRAPQGLDAPAAGWIDRLEVRQGGSIWGHVQQWTERAAQMIKAREYRFLSPVFTFEKATSKIRALVSAALTNSPNLNMTALNVARCAAEQRDTIERNAIRCWEQGGLERTYGTREAFVQHCLNRAQEHDREYAANNTVTPMEVQQHSMEENARRVFRDNTLLKQTYGTLERFIATCLSSIT